MTKGPGRAGPAVHDDLVQRQFRASRPAAAVTLDRVGRLTFTTILRVGSGAPCAFGAAGTPTHCTREVSRIANNCQDAADESTLRVVSPGGQRVAGVIHVDARPAPCEVDTASLAVVVVDMQNDFGAPGGMFDRAGIDIGPIQAIVGPIRHVVAAARSAGVPVIYLKMAFKPDLSDADPDSPTWLKHLPLDAGQPATAPDGTASRVLIRDSWNTNIVDALEPQPEDTVLYKHRYSGFYGTDLEAILQERGVTTIVIVGATTSVCVDSTVRDAVFRDIHCVVLEDCVAEPIAHDTPRSNHEATLLTLELLFANIAKADTLIAGLASVAVPR